MSLYHRFLSTCKNDKLPDDETRQILLLVNQYTVPLSTFFTPDGIPRPKRDLCRRVTSKDIKLLTVFPPDKTKAIIRQWTITDEGKPRSRTVSNKTKAIVGELVRKAGGDINQLRSLCMKQPATVSFSPHAIHFIRPDGTLRQNVEDVTGALLTYQHEPVAWQVQLMQNFGMVFIMLILPAAVFIILTYKPSVGKQFTRSYHASTPPPPKSWTRLITPPPRNERLLLQLSPLPSYLIQPRLLSKIPLPI